MLPETMWCLRLLLLVVLLPWSSSVKRGRTPAGTPLITECFAKLSSAPADAGAAHAPTDLSTHTTSDVPADAAANPPPIAAPDTAADKSADGTANTAAQ